MIRSQLGLYVHIPFCSALCHYCDFAKTANYTSALQLSYLEWLTQQAQAWTQGPVLRTSEGPSRFTSVFFGGGTPALLAAEYEPLMEIIHPWLVPGAEVSLEANPNNVTPQALTIWRDLGFNRLSIGVQSFDANGLRVLTRDHDADEAKRAIETALLVMPNVNVDLIYGWPGQSHESWRRDLNQLIELNVPHLSLYVLTYEGQTPMARAERRGKIKSTGDDDLAERYALACKVLNEAGYIQDEVSNWSKPTFSCHHNWLYWLGEYYVGIGAGAHGFVPGADGATIRYSYPKDLRQAMRLGVPNFSKAVDTTELKAAGIVIDEARTAEAVLLEQITSSLRTSKGVDLARAAATVQGVFSPSEHLTRALRDQQAWLQDGHLCFSPAEWFRESAWSLEVLRSFGPAKTSP